MERKIGCSITGIGDIQNAFQAGFNYVEVRGRDLVEYTEAEFKKLVKETIRYNMPVLGVNAYCSPKLQMVGASYNKDIIRSHAQICASRTAELGTKYIGIGSPNSRNITKNYSRKRAESQFIEFLSLTAEEFNQYGIWICVEPLAPCYCNFINTIQEAVEIVNSLSIDNIGIVADLYNMEKTNEPLNTLDYCINYIKHAHLSDDEGSPGKRFFLKPEKRVVHQNKIRSLYEKGYKGNLTLEIDCKIQLDKAKETLEIIRGAF